MTETANVYDAKATFSTLVERAATARAWGHAGAGKLAGRHDRRCRNELVNCLLPV